MDEVLKEKLITNAEALSILEKRAKERELNYEQKNALEHLKKYTTINDEKAKEMFQKLSDLGKLTERQIIMIINLLPKDRDDLRVILEKDYKNFSDQDKDLILDIIKQK
ncbi:MAG: RNA polymerase Rpb4 family protein [Candidatus Aenigmarchaeota archaeon]|nr:RNA polymerase Rpb4 family protein [Candidatus Aenigmarchaeota archaeon]MBU5689214.1 RNA polymerase Rpb4 family protein [Candidatus Aenigmarchaeota archaeon]